MGKVDKCIRLKGGRVGKKEMYKKNMADFIEELSDLPLKTQEAVLKNLSEQMIPLEIDGNIFMVHENVSKLIDNLVLQIEELKKRESSDWQRKE
mgnify:FL=1